MSEDPERESSPVVVPVRDDGTVCVERQDGPVTLRLMDAPLWLAFRQEGTEMIITKAGRRMFPFVMVKVEGLSPTLLYSVYLSLVPCDHRQYKFCQRRWVKVSDATTGPTPTPEQAYVHPASPNRGSFWCQEMISFAKLKITNNKHSQGDIVLQSMRKYMAQITVREDLGETQYVFPLPETTFVAVTQYQNEAVTRMKIAHNPFANGFKYAHVTGSEDGKKLFSRSDLSGIHDSKPQRSASTTGKSSTKAARVKATLSPQTLAPVILSTHGAHDFNLVSATLSLPTSLQPPHFSPALAMEAEPNPGSCLSLPEILSGGFPMSHTATVSPYVFRSEASSSPREESELRGMGLRPFRAAEASPETGGCSPDGDSRGRESVSDEEEEDCDDSVAKAASPTVPVPITTLPTTIADSEENTAGDTTTPDTNDSENADGSDEQSISLKSSSKGHLVGGLNVFSSFHSTPGLPANLSKKGGHFKQPLPRKGMVSGRKGEKRHLAGVEGTASGVAVVAADADMDWYQIRQGAGDWAVKHDRGVQLKLHDGHIWHSFAACGSKLVISAEGRNMFPVISVSLRGLDPGRLYSVWLHVTAADANAIFPSQARDQTLWGASRRPFTAPSVKPYMHPSSPMRGLAWMKAKVNFSEVRLTALTSDSDNAVGKSLSLQAGCRYLTQIVVREEEEVTPNGSGLISNIYFFPLPEVTFLTNLENEESKSTHPVASSDHCTSDTRKRFRENSDSLLEEDSDEIDVAALPSAKVSRGDVDSGQWMRSPVVLPRHADLSPLLSRQQDLSPLLPRQPDLCSRINPFYCFPPMSTLPPAHVGLLANRMPLPVTSPLQSITSFPFHPQLFPQLRTPMHTAFGLPLSPVNPFPYIYYPYSLPPTTLPSATASEASRGLDLSLKCSESR